MMAPPTYNLWPVRVQSGAKARKAPNAPQMGNVVRQAAQPNAGRAAPSDCARDDLSPRPC